MGLFIMEDAKPGELLTGEFSPPQICVVLSRLLEYTGERIFEPTTLSREYVLTHS